MSTRPRGRNLPSSQTTPPRKCGGCPYRSHVSIPPPLTKRSRGRHDTDGPALSAQPGESQRRPATNRSSRLIEFIGLPALPHLVLPVPLSRMVAPYARTFDPGPDRSEPPSPHTGYQHARTAEPGTQTPHPCRAPMPAKLLNLTHRTFSRLWYHIVANEASRHKIWTEIARGNMHVGDSATSSRCSCSLGSLSDHHTTFL
jgi:hypothetical protein